MRVALYYPWIYLTSGAERTILRLTEYSRHDWVLFTNHYEPANTFVGFAGCRVVELENIPVDRTVGKTAESCWRILRQKLPLEDFDALVVFCEGVGDLVVFRNHEKPVVCLCLTPLRIAFDEAYQARWSEGFSLPKRLAVRAGAKVFRIVDRLAWRHYSKRFCISNEVKRRVVKGGLAAPEQLEILYPALGVQPEELQPVYEPFFLLPGRIMWTKNIELGIEAFHQFRRECPELAHFRLVIAGIVDRKSEPYFKKLQVLAGTAGNVEFRVFPSDRELADLYGTCWATLFTAFNEDYGMAPLEGMAHGKAAIVVNRGGPRETVEHGVQGYLEEPEPAAFAGRMAELARSESLARTMGAAGVVHSRNFNWRDFSRRIDEALNALAPPRNYTAKDALPPSQAFGEVRDELIPEGKRRL